MEVAPISAAGLHPAGGPVMAAYAPLGACAVPRCLGRATHRGRCERHAQQDRRERYKRNNEHLYDGKWKATSQAFIAGKSCVDCARPAEVTDHSTPHRGNRAAFWDRSLWVPRCWSCHSSKTVREDGGFGAPSRSHARHERDDEAVTWG